MKVKIYLDIFFLVNAMMNLSLLTVQSLLQKKYVSIGRRILASLAGAGLALFLLLTRLHRYLPLFAVLYLGGSLLVVRIAFGKSGVSSLVKNLIFFYLSAIVLAGFLYQLQVLTGGAGRFLYIFAGTVVMLCLICRFLPRAERWQGKKRSYFSVRITYQGRSVRGDGLLDSGNHLTDPFSGEPVAVAQKSFLAPLWKGGELPLFRYIPFRTIGTSDGMIPVFRCAGLELLDRDGDWQPLGDSWIAVCEHEVSSDGEYEVILHPDMQKEIN